ncbi:unnamed protein product [Paramecium octaurelia]|uniref:Protein kinase domain-containing protein n=1 Tax=Paramecium octaurelia TaxID=43137 RepID=A0A8S1T4G1_PAROT|nr:unnamed protein product [Paramecium octaurelia]
MQQIPRIQISHFSYLQSDLIGSGYKSQVYKGVNDLNGDQVAIKVCNMKQLTNEVELMLLNQEIQALGLLDSPNIVKMYQCIRSQSNTYIITEYCNQGDLAQLIEKKNHLQENEATQLFKQIITGFLEQTRKGIIHRDIKPSNILLSNGIPKIADYGFSKMMGVQEKVYYNVGTTLYMSPQALMDNQYSEKSDIWSIGIMFYQTLCGCTPWVAETEKEFIKLITTTPIQFPKKILLSLHAKDFIIKCLQVDMNKRFSANQLLDHPLFNEKPRLLQISGSFHITRGQTQYQQQQKDNEWKRRLSPREVIDRNYSNNYFNHPPKPQFSIQNPTKDFLQNDLILQNIFYLLKLILRVAKLIDHFDFFNQNCLQEKILYFMIKHALFKTKQFKLMMESNVNTLGLVNFHQYTLNTDLKKQYSTEINEFQHNFTRSFERLWIRVQDNQNIYKILIQDQKFAAAFDKSDLEVLTHYVLMLPVLKQAIYELRTVLSIKLNLYTDFQIPEPREEAAIILLDYLVLYSQICNNIAQNQDNFTYRITQFQLKKVVETKPINNNKCKYRDICKQIGNLQLML